VSILNKALFLLLISEACLAQTPSFFEQYVGVINRSQSMAYDNVQANIKFTGSLQLGFLYQWSVGKNSFLGLEAEYYKPKSDENIHIEDLSNTNTFLRGGLFYSYRLLNSYDIKFGFNSRQELFFYIEDFVLKTLNKEVHSPFVDISLIGRTAISFLKIGYRYEYILDSEVSNTIGTLGGSGESLYIKIFFDRNSRLGLKGTFRSLRYEGDYDYNIQERVFQAFFRLHF
jgi:hypothetical protein